ncbi:DUF5134 domain-containing protein [Streptomyces sedi]|uniref:DUF5134 domain-containing protein n=1 Tax=Streptomyces sedi TaxID=555059 RepID=A0A5C4UVI1_9ACTN|nr:DUF5134 domain-containing protein [Streptomyces sedi]TNM27681.1 DUF5134 domain-containing protein [Streptomyces sedi]
MDGPELVCWLLVAVCGGAGAWCLARLRRAAPGGRQGPALEAAMGLAMALMAAGMAGGPAAPDWVLVAVSAATVAGALPPLGLRARHRAHHAVEGAGMLYMAWAMAGGAHGAHAAHGAGAGVPALTGALLLYCALHVLRTAPRLVPAGPGAEPAAPGGDPGGGRGGGRGDEDEVAVACRLALTVGMAAMLLAM